MEKSEKCHIGDGLSQSSYSVSNDDVTVGLCVTSGLCDRLFRIDWIAAYRLPCPPNRGSQIARYFFDNHLRRHVKPLTLKSLRNRHLFVADALSVFLAPLVAFLVRFEEASWISQNLRLVALYLLISIPLRLAIFYAAG